MRRFICLLIVFWLMVLSAYANQEAAEIDNNLDNSGISEINIDNNEFFDLFKDVSSLYNSQTGSGKVITILILFCFISYFAVYLFVIKRYYDKIFREITRKRQECQRIISSKISLSKINSSLKDVLVFREPFLVSVEKEFTYACFNGVTDLGETNIVNRQSYRGVDTRVKCLERLISYAPALVVLLGLLGTFWGLTGAIDKISRAEGVTLVETNVSTEKDTDLSTLLDNITDPLSNMSTAFITSLTGVMATILLTIGDKLLGVSAKRADTFAEVEDFFNSYFAPYIRQTIPSEKTPIVTAGETIKRSAELINNGFSNFTRSFDELNKGMENLYSEFAKVVNTMDKMTKAFEKEHEAIPDIRDMMSKYIEAFEGLNKVLVNIDTIGERNSTMWQQVAISYDLLQKQHKAMEKIIEPYINA